MAIPTIHKRIPKDTISNRTVTTVSNNNKAACKAILDKFVANFNTKHL